MAGLMPSIAYNGVLCFSLKSMIDSFRVTPKKLRCSCCPYGYHIHLDFLDFCNEVSTGTYLSRLRKLKKYKRKQRKSVQAMLGQATENVETACALERIPRWEELAVRQNGSGGESNADDRDGSPTKYDAELREALDDFEESLERSRNSSRASTLSRRGTSVGPRFNHADLSIGADRPVRNGRHFSGDFATGQRASSCGPANDLRRSGSAAAYTMYDLTRTMSTSSLSSMSSASSAHDSLVKAAKRRDGNDSDAISTNSAASSVPEALLTARGNVAQSLTKVRELEEIVKVLQVGVFLEYDPIPVSDKLGFYISQVKVSVLKEENRQLSLNKQDPRNRSVGGSFENDEIVESSPSPQLNHETDSSVDRSRHTPIRERRKVSLKDLRDPLISPECKPEVPVRKVSTRDSSMSACPLTREVGTSSIPPGVRSVSCTADLSLGDPESKKTVKPKPCFKCIQRSTKRLTTIAVGPDESMSNEVDASSVGTSGRPEAYDNFLENMNKSSPILARLCRATSVPPAITIDMSAQTEEEAAKAVDSIAVNTDLRHGDFLTFCEHRSILEKAATITSDASCQAALPAQLVNPFALTKQTQTELLGRDFARQLSQAREISTVEKTVFINPADQSLVVTTADFGLQVNTEALWESRRLQRSIATGSDDPAEYLLPNNQLAKKVVHAAVGDFDINEGEQAAASVVPDLRCVGVQCTISSASRSVQTQRMALRSIGTKMNPCETADISVNTDEIEQKEPVVKPVEKMSSGVNTEPWLEEKVEPAAVMSVIETTKLKRESAPSTPEVDRKAFGVSLCDNCMAEIRSVAKDFVQKADEDILRGIPAEPDGADTPSTTSTSTLPPIPTSRIPRPVSLQVPKPTNQPDAPASVGSKIPQRTSPSIPASQRTPTLLRKMPEIPSKLKRGRYSPSNSGKQTPSPPARSGSLDRLASARLAEGRARARERSALQRELESPSPSQTPPCVSAEKSPLQETKEPLGGSVAKTFAPRKAVDIPPSVKKALATVSDSVKAKHDLSTHLDYAQALHIVQEEWFKMTSSVEAKPDVVETYLDFCEEISKELLNKIVNLMDASGNTAMHYAVSNGNFDVVSLLLDSKVCDVNLQNKAGYTCTMLVSLAQTVHDTVRQVVRRLFHMADVNIRASQMVKLLLEAGADLNIQDTDGSTALMCAAEHGHIDIVRYLLSQADCDATLLDMDGSSALQIALDAGHKDIGVMIYHHLNFSPSSSPMGPRVRGKSATRSGSLPRRTAITPPPRTPPPHTFFSIRLDASFKSAGKAPNTRRRHPSERFHSESHCLLGVTLNRSRYAAVASRAGEGVNAKFSESRLRAHRRHASADVYALTRAALCRASQVATDVCRF
ncbi:unnamed protein product [Notodromas monacha]|uniref:KN motif and ankyrin repeat domain-containing protein 1 n=1 Tax=Notodromas monacha TaxID=399045 RepID=A0A7R9G8X2_9CRUS|nr:unnamed protein product [Notodromas monacha]CAG0912543.1 unnamed protein product [Notodromas monacha]